MGLLAFLTQWYKRGGVFLLLAGSFLGIELSASLLAGMLLYQMLWQGGCG